MAEPTHPVLTPMEQEVVRLAADWVERADLYEADQSQVPALLMIIDRLFPHGAVRLGQAPRDNEPFPPPTVVAMGPIDGDGRRMSFDAQWPELPWGTRVLIVADPNYRCPTCGLYRHPWSETDDTDVWPGTRMARLCPRCGSDKRPEGDAT